MRIMHVNAGGFGGGVDGIAVVEEELIRLLAEAGHDAHHFDARSGSSPRETIRAVFEAKRAGVDVVHLHSLFRPTHCALAGALRLCGVPYVVSPHSALSPAALRRDGIRKRLFLALFDRSLLGDAAAVLCLTECEERDVLAVCPGARTEIVPNPHLTRASDRWSWAPRARPTIVTLARYDVYQKGLDYLSLLACALPEADVCVHGAPDHNEVELIGAVSRTAPSNFRLAEPVRGPEKQQTLLGASLYVQASRWEGLSISLIEALTLGVPVAVSEAVAETVPIAERGMGIVMSPDPWIAAGAIRELLGDPERQRAMSSAGVEWVREALDPEHVVAMLAGVYGRANGRARGTGRRDRADTAPVSASLADGT